MRACARAQKQPCSVGHLGSQLLPSPCPLRAPCSSGTAEATNLPPALGLVPERDGSIINPKLKSLNRAIHRLGKSADSILRLVKSNEIVSENL